ncbi:hypothetical protein NDU88_009849, partial [Pleurodeles waltl]
GIRGLLPLWGRGTGMGRADWGGLRRGLSGQGKKMCTFRDETEWASGFEQVNTGQETFFRGSWGGHGERCGSGGSACNWCRCAGRGCRCLYCML